MLTDEDRQEYQSLLKEYDQLLAEIKEYKVSNDAQNSAQTTPAHTSDEDTDTPEVVENTATTDETVNPKLDDSLSTSSLSASDEARLAELRKKLNL